MNRLTRYQYLTIRLILWFVAVFIALIPALKATNDIHELADGERFKDLLFVVVPVAALALSTTLDYLCVGFPALSAKAFFNCVCSTILNGVGLMTGLSGFLSIHAGQMSQRALVTYGCLIAVTVFASLICEIFIALWHHSFQDEPNPIPEPSNLATVKS